MPKEGLDRIREMRKVIPVMAFVLALATAFAFFYRNIPYRTLFMNGNYQSLGQGYFGGMLLRGITLLVGFLCVFFFTAILPMRKTIFTYFGRCSITIYLGHSVIIRLLKRLKFLRGIRNPVVFVAVGILFALIVCILFGNRKITKVYQWVMGKVSNVVIL